MTSVLEAADIKVALDSESGIVRAVDGVSIALRKGETFALVGESGCGKSMTALALMRLLPDNGRIVSGSITLEGQELLALPEVDMRRMRGGRVAIIFQEPSTSLNPVMRIGEQIAETIRTHTPLRGASVRAKSLEWLERVGLPDAERRIDNYPFQLSGGQKQRVMIALALAAEPEVLIADEPTTALDVTIQAQILDLLKQLQAEQGMAILLITHDLGIVSQMAHQVALMYAGQIVEQAAADDFFKHPLHPYARKLFDALPDALRRNQPLAAIAGSVPPLNQIFMACRFSDRCPSANEHCREHVPELFNPEAEHRVRCFIYDFSLSPEQRPGQPSPLIPFPEGEGGKNPSPSGRRAGMREGFVPANQPTTLDKDSFTNRHSLEDGNPVFLNLVDSRSPTKTIEDKLRGNDSQKQDLLTVQNLSVHFPIRKGLLKRTVGYVKAVDGVSFSIAPGRTLALVGESGCGKTTIGKTVLQLLRGQADIGGEILFQGQPLNHLNGKKLFEARRGIQIIFQDPFASLDPRMRVAEILEEGMIALRPEWSAQQRSARLTQLLDQVGLRADVMDRYPHEFSGGQRQRLAIARALAVEPKVVVCDEPTSALDVSVQAQILNLLRQLQADLGVAYLFITHNIGVVEYLAHDVAVMRQGKIVEHGASDSVLYKPQNSYTKTLLNTVPRVRRMAGSG